MRRFQIMRAVHKTWRDPGPDLLFRRRQVTEDIEEDLKASNTGWFVRSDSPDHELHEWTGPMSRAEVIDRFETWEPSEDARSLQVGRKGTSDRITVKTRVRATILDVRHETSCTDQTDVANALITHAFSHMRFAGAFVNKDEKGNIPPKPGVTLSYHAVGRAVDRSDGDDPDQQTPDLTDWCLRMARRKALPVFEVFGALMDGGERRVGFGKAPDFSWKWGGVTPSHEWHVHLSTGLNP